MSLLPSEIAASMPKLPVVILGAEKHARALMDAIRHGDEFEVSAILDDREELHGAMVHGAPVLGPLESILSLREHGIEQFAIGLTSTADPVVLLLRENLFNVCVHLGIGPATVIHPESIIAEDVALNAATVVLSRAIINAHAQIGVNTIIGPGAIVEHECTVGDHAHIAMGAILCGNVTVGHRSHVGTGAVVRQGVTIGESAVIGPGSVVIRDVADGEAVSGVPARPVSIEVDDIPIGHAAWDIDRKRAIAEAIAAA